VFTQPSEKGRLLRRAEVARNLPTLEEGQFPPDAISAGDRRRFLLALGIARELMDEQDGPKVWMMARSIYRNPDLPT
jgi:hypothetical protein